MNNEHRFADRALKASRLQSNAGPANSGNLIAFPIHRTKRYLEARMLRHGDSAGYCRNGLSAQEYRTATDEDRAIYRKWGLRLVVFYSAVLLISGVAAILAESSPGLQRLTSLSTHATVVSARSH
jgi:hypothetical protein